jgi:HemY protein
MTRPLLFAAAVALLVALAVWLANDPGGATLVWHGWRIDTSVAVLLIAAAVLAFLLLVALRLIGWIQSSVRSYRIAQRERRMTRGLTALGDGFAAVHAGLGAAARRLAREAETLLQDNPAVLVLRKQAAALDGDATELRAAAEPLLARPQTELAALKALATKAIADGDVVGALAHAKRALARKEAPAWAVHLALDAEIAARRWAEALEILENRSARDVFPPTDYRRLRARLVIHHAEDLLAQGQATAAAAAAHKVMDDEGGTAATATYARAMAAQGKGKKAAADVEEAWERHPDPRLLQAYRALVPAEAALAWARRVERLVEANPDHPESRLALAEASLAAELWGQARNRLGGLTSGTYPAAVRARAARLMAEVERAEHGDSAAVSRWLREAIDAGQTAAATVPKPVTTAALLAET